MKIKKVPYIIIAALLFSLLMGFGRFGIEWFLSNTITPRVLMVYTVAWFPVGLLIGYMRWEKYSASKDM